MAGGIEAEEEDACEGWFCVAAWWKEFQGTSEELEDVIEGGIELEGGGGAAWRGGLFAGGGGG